MRIGVRTILFSLLLLVVFLSGMVVGRFQLFPYPQLHWLKMVLQQPGIDKGVYVGTRDRTRLPCETFYNDKTLVLMAIGQSNAANSGETPYTPEGSVYNFFDNTCYLAKDPLLGTGDVGGSVWTRFAELVLEQQAGRYDSILFVPLAVGASEIAEWQPNTPFFQRIETAYAQLKNQGIELDTVVWHQGEMDALLHTPQAVYVERLNHLIDGLRGLGIDAPVHVSVASMVKHRTNPVIQAAQQQVIEQREDVLAGPNTDALVIRKDGTHFSDLGLKIYAEAMYDAVFPQ